MSVDQPRTQKRETLREGQKALTRHRLVEGAIETFRDKGYPTTTVDDIAAAAGASRATFYLHFKNKLEIMECIYADLEPEVAKNFARLDQALQDGPAEVRTWISDMLAWYEDHRAEMVALEQVIAIEGEGAAGLHRDYLAYMPQLASGLDEATRLEVRIKVWLLSKMLSRLYLMWRVDGQFPAAHESSITDVVADLWIKGFEI